MVRAPAPTGRVGPSELCGGGDAASEAQHKYLLTAEVLSWSGGKERAGATQEEEKQYLLAQEKGACDSPDRG